MTHISMQGRIGLYSAQATREHIENLRIAAEEMNKHAARSPKRGALAVATSLQLLAADYWTRRGGRAGAPK